VTILLQNRAEFAEALTQRIPDPKLRNLLAVILTTSDTPEWKQLTLDKSISKISKLALLDPLCKAGIGRKWGRTTISADEALERAMRFEELVVIACSFQEESTPSPEFKLLRQHASDRLAALIGLADELRYHRLRLVELP